MSAYSLRSADKSERLAYRASMMPKDARCILEHENGSALYVYERTFPTGQTKLYAIAFWGTSGKPQLHYSYPNEQQRQQAIDNWKHSVEQSVKLRSEAAKARTSEPCTLKAGDIVNTSWGYDQTNVDFYIVTRVSGKRVYLRQIASDYEATGHMSGRCWPRMPIEMIGPEFWAMGRGTHTTIDGHSANLTTGDTYTSSYA